MNCGAATLAWPLKFFNFVLVGPGKRLGGPGVCECLAVSGCRAPLGAAHMERGAPALPPLCGLAELQAGRVCLGPKLAV